MNGGHWCPVEGCEERVPNSVLMCRGHWYSIPKAMRDELWRAYKSSEGIFGERYDRARKACIAAAERNGYVA